jgi:hypothetical protein
MSMPYTKSGKCGGTVWQRNRYGQISYPAFIPFNPRSPAQVAVRGNFGGVSARWRKLTEEQRRIWMAVALTIKSKPRLGQSGPLTGCQLFVKINVALANRGKAQVDLPPAYLRSPQPPVADDGMSNAVNVIKISPRMEGWQDNLQEVTAVMAAAA